MKRKPKTMAGLLAAAGLLCCSLAAAAGQIRSQVPLPAGAVTLAPAQTVNGGVLLVKIDPQKLGPPVTDLMLKYEGRRVLLFRYPTTSRHLYWGLLGIAWRTAPGRAAATLTWTGRSGRRRSPVAFGITAGKYRTESLQVAPRRVHPSKKERTRAAREFKEVKGIYAHGRAARLWHGPFQLPIKSRITSPFGSRRVFNGQLKSWHNGVDFRAAPGQPVYAANSGIVRLAKNLFYSGNIVIIDHGTGIFTLYAHLSKIYARCGRPVEKGTQIGLSGATGRVNGPHLHWGVKVNGVSVNPLQFVRVIGSLTAKNG